MPGEIRAVIFLGVYMSSRKTIISGDYIPPTAQEIRELMNKYNLTGSKLARLVGVNPRITRYWTSPTKPREMPYAEWMLLLVITGEIEVEELKESLINL